MLDALPSEVLSQICDAVAGPPIIRKSSLLRLQTNFIAERRTRRGHSHALCSLSETCSRIRAVCAPKMFHWLTLTEHESTLPPAAVLSYIRQLKLRVADPAARTQVDYAGFIGQLSGLLDLFWVPQYPVILNAHNLAIISRASSMASVTIGDFRVSGKSCTTTFPSRVRALDLCHWRSNLFTLTREDAKTENAFLESLISPAARDLEVLRLPAETCRLSFLASSAWTSLRELTLQGGTPRLDAPFAQVLAAMPRLRVLSATFVRFASMPFVLLPANTDTTVDLQLLRLTITDPEPGEAIFSHVAESLEELCVREMPRNYVRRLEPCKYSAQLLPCATALSIIRALRATNLRRLELVVREDDAELDLMAALACSCPALEYLEFHRYARDDFAFIDLNVSQVKIPTLTLANALTPLKRLRMLRLNMDLGVDVNVWRQLPEDVYQYWHPFIEQQVMLIAPILPWLNSISFLTAHPLCTVGWSTWQLGQGGTEVRYIRNVDLVDCDCVWL